MKTKRTHYLAVVLVLPLLFLVVGCDAGGGGMLSDDFPREAAYRIDCFVPEGTTQMVFEASGALEDEGTVDGDPLSLDEGSSTGVVYREFEGQKGRMALRVVVNSVRYGSPIAEGTYTVLGSSGAYARLQSQGEFKAAIDEHGDLVEIFSGRTN